MLVNHFIEKYNRPKEKNITGIDPEAMETLQRYGWPGNVRELENAIERAVLLAETGLIKLEHLPTHIREKSQKAGKEFISLPYHGTFKAATDRFSQMYLEAALKRSRGNVTQAAKDAGIERESFHRLLKKHGLKAEDFRSS